MKGGDENDGTHHYRVCCCVGAVDDWGMSVMHTFRMICLTLGLTAAVIVLFFVLLVNRMWKVIAVLSICAVTFVLLTCCVVDSQDDD